MKFSSKADLIAELKRQFNSNEFVDKNGHTQGERQLTKALMTIYANQTESEQETGDTHYRNGVGFTPADANFLSSFAAQYQTRNFLSKKQYEVLRAKMPKYARQIIEGSIAKGLIKQENGFYIWGK